MAKEPVGKMRTLAEKNLFAVNLFPGSFMLCVMVLLYEA